MLARALSTILTITCTLSQRVEGYELAWASIFLLGMEMKNELYTATWKETAVQLCMGYNVDEGMNSILVVLLLHTSTDCKAIQEYFQYDTNSDDIPCKVERELN